MTAIVWLIFVCLAAIALFVIAGVIDTRDERRTLPRVVQPVRPVRPAPQPLWIWGDLPRARQARAARARRRSTGGNR